MLVSVSRRLELPVYHGSLRFGTALQKGAAVLHAVDGFIQERHLPVQLVWFGKEARRLRTGEKEMGFGQTAVILFIQTAPLAWPSRIFLKLFGFGFPLLLLDHKPRDGEETRRSFLFPYRDAGGRNTA